MLGSRERGVDSRERGGGGGVHIVISLFSGLY